VEDWHSESIVSEKTAIRGREEGRRDGREGGRGGREGGRDGGRKGKRGKAAYRDGNDHVPLFSCHSRFIEPSCYSCCSPFVLLLRFLTFRWERERGREGREGGREGREEEEDKRERGKELKDEIEHTGMRTQQMD